MVFSGESMKSVAAKLGIGDNTVYNRFNDFREKAKEVGLMGVAREFGVETEIKQLRTLAGEVKEGELSVDQCIRGARIATVLRRHKAKEADLETFIDSAYKEAATQKISPSELVSLASDLKKYTTGKNQSYKEFTESLKVETEKNEEYKTENSRLLKEINQNARARNHGAAQGICGDKKRPPEA
jgi:transposase-like protein